MLKPRGGDSVNLQQMVLEVINAMGGVAETTEYALAQVLLPDEYKTRFQGRTELILAFDYEVAEEHPEADFITFGSELAEVFLDMALKTPLSDTRYALADRVAVYNAKERAGRFLGQAYNNIRVISERPMMGLWSLYRFRARFASSESFEEERNVCINMLTGERDAEIEELPIFYEREPVAEYPYVPACSFSEAYKLAREHIAGIADNIAKSVANPVKVRHETERISNYYGDLIEENRRRLTRKGLTAEREEEIRRKNEALKLEMRRQTREIQENLIPTYMVDLAHGVTLHIPLIEIICDVSDRLGATRHVLYYECLTKRMFEPALRQEG